MKTISTVSAAFGLLVSAMSVAQAPRPAATPAPLPPVGERVEVNITNVDVADTSCTPAQAPGMCATFESVESYAFVINNHGEEKLVSLIQTDNVGGGAKIFLTGEARRQ